LVINVVFLQHIHLNEQPKLPVFHGDLALIGFQRNKNIFKLYSMIFWLHRQTELLLTSCQFIW